MKLGLIGVSVRPAAEALATDHRLVLAVDFFADHDTRLALPNGCFPIRDWAAIPDWAQWQKSLSRQAGGPIRWMPLGGLDLQPQVLAGLRQPGGPLLGCSLETFRFCKSPELWCPELSAAGFSIPQYHDGRLSPSGAWYLKESWSDHRGHRAGPAGWFWQQQCSGTLGSAVYLSHGNQVQWVGCSRLFVTPDYRYQGNVASLHWPEPSTQSVLYELGQALAKQTKMVGLFGIDFFLADGVWPIEINPRPTASVEILAQLTGRPLYQDHLAACLHEPDGSSQPGEWLDDFHPPKPRGKDEIVVPGGLGGTPPFVAKRIIYNGRYPKTIQPADFEWLRENQAPQTCTIESGGVSQEYRFRIADIPNLGTQIPAHEPLCTILAASEKIQRGATCPADTFWNDLRQLLPRHLTCDEPT